MRHEIWDFFIYEKLEVGSGNLEGGQGIMILYAGKVQGGAVVVVVVVVDVRRQAPLCALTYYYYWHSSDNQVMIPL